MKGSKDFDMSRFAPDSSTIDNTVAASDAQQSKRSVPTATSKPTGRDGAVGETASETPTRQPERTRLADKPAQTPSGEQTVKPRQTVSTLPTEQLMPSHQTVSAQSIEPTQSVQPIQPHRTSTRQRKASFDEYREVFLQAPKIIDRQPVFVSRETRDRIDDIVRKLGERKMSVSGFLENLARHHLETYREDIEQWKRL